MRVTVRSITEGVDEVEIRCHSRNEEVNSIIKYIEQRQKKLMGSKEKEQFWIDPSEVLYLESVDNNTYLYTKEQVLKTPYTLLEISCQFPECGFFRCSKSMILNLYQIRSLTSLTGNRIDALMENGEHVLISRRYAKELRNVLKEGLS